MPLGEQFRARYPGLIPVAAQLWRDWLREHEGEWVAFEYNVHVGQGIKHPTTPVPGIDPEFAAAQAETFRRGSQRRIDVVAHKPGEVWVIEVDERPGTRALGQLLIYRNLLSDARNLTVDPGLMLICDHIGPDTLETFDEHGIQVWQRNPKTP